MPPSSSSAIRSRPVFRPRLGWLLPPATGVAVYFLTLQARQGHAATTPAAPSPSALAPRDAPLRRDAVEAFAEAGEADLAARSAAFEPTKPDPTTPDAIRQRLLEIQSLLTALNANQILADFGKRDALRNESARLAVALGRLEGEAALKWLAEHGNDTILRNSIFTGWAMADPAAAWQHLLTSTHPDPCSRETFMYLIGATGHDDPATLKAAVDAAPWDLFNPGYDIRQNPLNVPPDADYQVWIDSGAARAAIEQGVTLEGIFPRWFLDAPQDALAAWASWPSPDTPARSDAFLMEILENAWRRASTQDLLKPGQDSDSAIFDPLAQAFSSADPAISARLAESLARLQQQPYASNAIKALGLREKAPDLFPTPAATGDGH
jgi:hypothetical protein